VQQPANKLDDLERQRLLAIANSPEFGHLPPSQIVPRLLCGVRIDDISGSQSGEPD
jgi:hypothetical protein